MALDNLTIRFGATGAPQTVTLAEQLYAALPVGFGSVTQERWRSNTITVNGIDFTVFPAIDSDGRADCWVYAAYKEAATPNTDAGENRQFATVDLQVTLNGVAQNLFGAGTTYTYDHQRSTWLRWQSGAMAWDTSSAFINARIADGTFLRHDSRNIIGSMENSSYTDLPTDTTYKPYKAFCQWDQLSSVGDVPRGQVGGAERTSIGPVHEWFARLVSEVGTNNNPAWLTATRLQILKNLADSAGQFPIASGLLEPVTSRLLDPSVKPHCCHGNAAAWGPMTGIPQPGMLGTSASLQDGSFDNAHPFNKTSFHAWHLSHDPFHLLTLQGQAVAGLAYQPFSSYYRGTDGKTLVITAEQERSLWWGLQMLVQAWHATPSGTMPKPFRDKAWFASAINNTLQWIRDKCVSSTTHQTSGVIGEAMRFWRVTSALGDGADASYAAATHFQEDYGHIVLAQALLLGYSGARDVAEWHIVNLQRRLDLGGNWYLNDPARADATGYLYYALGPKTGTLPYADTASYKTWYPYKQKYVDGDLNADGWTLDYGRDTYLFMAAVNLNKEAAQRGLMTPGFDLAAAEGALKARHKPPYTNSGNGSPLNYTAYAKQYFSYPDGSVILPGPGPVTSRLQFLGGPQAALPQGVSFIEQVVQLIARKGRCRTRGRI